MSNDVKNKKKDVAAAKPNNDIDDEPEWTTKNNQWNQKKQSMYKQNVYLCTD